MARFKTCSLATAHTLMGERACGLYRDFDFFSCRVKLATKLTATTALQPDTVARLMSSFREGDPEAAGRLVELFYPELRRIAAARMRAERPDHTLQPTAVVHQLYLELVKIKALRPTGRAGRVRRPSSWAWRRI